MLRFSRLLLGTVTGAMVALAAGAANATLTIDINGTNVATDPTNTAAVFTDLTGATAAHWNINNVIFSGINALLDPNLADVGTFSVSSDNLGADLNITATETNLSIGVGGNLRFLSNFSNAIPDNISYTRSFYLDATNSGLETSLLAQVSGTGAQSIATTILSPYFAVPGQYSITEDMTFHIVDPLSKTAANISADDKLRRVPEPPTLVLIGAAILGLGFLRFRAKKAACVSV